MGRLTMKILALLFLAGLAAAEDIAFEASVDKSPVGLGDQFTLSLTLRNAGMSGGRNLQPPDLGKFHLMSGPSQSTNMQIINGVVSSAVTYSYVLQPKEMGKFTIGSASIEAEGKTYKTAPVSLEVVKGTPRQRQQTNVPPDVSGQIGDNLFLRAVVDRSRVMQGEQINLIYKLYTRVSIANYGIEKNPPMTGFWSEDVELPKNIQLTTEVVNGKQYRVGAIRRMALFPTQSGTLEISPLELTTTVHIQPRSPDPFDAFFRDPFGQTINYKVRSEAVKISVAPLPVGAPAGFKGAVGRFTMRTTVDKEKAKTNDPISLKIAVSGTGNIKLLESPEVEIPNDFEQYTPKVTDAISKQRDRISGTKTFEYLMIPRFPGQKVIRPVKFVYFDLDRKEYVVLRSQQIDLAIEQGPAGSVPLAAAGSRQDIRMLSQDIRFIKVTNLGLTRAGEYVHTSPMFILLLVLPVLGFAGAFVFARQRQAEMRDEVGYRTRRAVRVAQKGLRHAEHLLPSDAAASSTRNLEFHTEVSCAVYAYLRDKLNIQQAEMSIEGAVAELHKRSVPQELTAALKELLDYCEMARYAPATLGASAMQQTYDTAKKLIVGLERTLRAK